jgi:hypothetical protein
MPWKFVKPCALDFDTNLAVYIGLSFERELIVVLFATDHRWKSAQGTAPSRLVSNYLSAPMFSSMRRTFSGIVDQSFDGIDVARIKSPDRIVLHHGNSFTRRPVGDDKETVNAVSHNYNYHIYK